MKKTNYYFGIAVVSGACALWACSGDKKEAPSVQDTVPVETVNSIAEQISQLEAQREELQNEIQRDGDRWCLAHPDVPDDEAIDSLNAITEKLRTESQQLRHKIDSLKALL